MTDSTNLIRILGLEKKTRFYQASTSELYGLVQEIPQKENHTVLSPQPVLGWESKTTLAELVAIMIREDLKSVKRDVLCEENGFEVRQYNE